VDVATGPLTYNPSTGTLQATTLRGAYVATGTTNLNGFDTIGGADITATRFIGALQGNADTATTAGKSTNIAGGAVGNISYQVTTDTTAFLTNGASGTVLTSGGVGNNPTWTAPSTTATTVSITDTNINASYYPTFVSAAGASQTLSADIAANPLSYNPSTGVLTATNFTGSLTGLASESTAIAITDTNTNATFYPTFVSAAGTNQTLRADIATSSLSYNPNTATLQTENVTVTNTFRPARINDVLASGGTSGQVLTCGTGNSVVWGSANNSAIYGYGWDGAVVLDGSGASEAYSFASFNGTFYTLIRDVYATTFNVSASIILVTAGFRIFATTSITLATGAIVANNGSAGSLTTAGVGASAGYFRASGNGATGLLTASAGAVGAAPTVPTAATWVGMLGGRGACARTTATTFVGTSPMTVANYNLSEPADADGGRYIINNINFWNQRSLATASALWHPTASLGGAAGSKSIIGTAATSGGGGGGGGFMFLASPTITGDNSSIRAVGGAGGAANGTGGNFGGGGGGGVGIIGVLTGKSSYNSALFNVSGGAGGTSVWLGTIAPVGEANGTGTSTTANPLAIFPTNSLSTATVYILSLHTTGSAGIVASAVSVTGGNCGTWINITRVDFNPAPPLSTRKLEVWAGLANGNLPYSDDPRILVYFNVTPTTVRYIVDGIQNTQWVDGNDPLDRAISNTGTGTSASNTLASVPLATNMQYSVLARSGGTAPVAGTGNTLLTQGTTAPILISQVATGRQTNAQTWTTSADWAFVTVDLSASGTGEPGIKGENGKVVPFLV
jgi:hypothetical protein